MARCAKGGVHVKSDREILRAIQGQANEVRFGPGMVQNKDGSWSPKLDPRSNLRVDANGAITSEFGPEFEVIPGSPRAARLKPQRVRVEAVQGLPERLATQEATIATKAAQTDLDALAATTADFDTAGLARKVEDPGEVSIDTGDVPGSLEALRDAINALRTAMTNADIMGTR